MAITRTPQPLLGLKRVMRCIPPNPHPKKKKPKSAEEVKVVHFVGSV